MIEGNVKHITYYNDDNGYAIIKVHINDTTFKRGLFDDLVDDTMTVTGYFPKPAQGETYRFFGELTTHPKYGEQFSAKSYERLDHTNKAGIIDYLSSDLFKGIGEKTAEHIVKTLGTDAIKKIIEDKTVLDEVDKISDKQKDTVYQSLIENKASEQTLIKLYGYGISSKIAMRIINAYQEETIKKLEKNPYQMIQDIDGIGFDRADTIAKTLGFSDDHPYRINALITHVFYEAVLKNGHTHIDLETFKADAIKRLNQDSLDPHILEKELDALIQQKVFYLEDNLLTLNRVFKAENTISTKLKNLTNKATIDTQKVYDLITTFEKKEAIKYTSEQKQAIIMALTHQSSILTGGPGTGKTTVIKGIIEIYYTYHNLKSPRDEESSLIKLIAPTGRAAKRMQESTNTFATTIHRLLGYSYDGTFMHNAFNPVEGNLFIVDEASMIDIFLAAQLLESLPDYVSIVFVGDDAQLPSVGPGQVFKDIIDAAVIPSITLSIIHRQSQDSHIIDLASHIRQGSLPEDLLNVYDDRVIFKENTHNFHPRLKRIIDYMLNQGYDLLDDIQVLIPMYRGNVGINETNNFLQATYNQNNAPSINHLNRTFKVNDKVLQLTNQLEDGIMNGDQGKVVEIDEQSSTLTVQFMDNRVDYKTKDLINLNHAYAMSIHKSQGSEYKVVILPIFKSYSIMLRRKLIYTAITRAKEKVVILGDIDKLSYAVKALEAPRQTRLKDKLTSELPKLNTSKKRTDDPLPLRRETDHKIHDDSIPFDTLGEDLNGVTPYDFLDD